VGGFLSARYVTAKRRELAVHRMIASFPIVAHNQQYTPLHSGCQICRRGQRTVCPSVHRGMNARARARLLASDSTWPSLSLSLCLCVRVRVAAVRKSEGGHCGGESDSASLQWSLLSLLYRHDRCTIYCPCSNNATRAIPAD